MIYISSPYTDRDQEVIDRRMEVLTLFVRELMLGGESPISIPLHFHQMVKDGVLPISGEFWERYYTPILVSARVVYVLMLDGWDTSSGIAKELQLAVDSGIPVVYYRVSGKHFVAV